jgi:pimeloyl-ACP methyl ester carboxylesterase
VSERVVVVDGVELCLETFGRPEDPAVLLVGGATASMDWWDPAFCELLAAQGRLVVRYDHRDTGRSTSSPPGRPAYTGADLTADAVRILDALGVGRAHLVGVSAGGGIVQELAAFHAGRVLTVTLIATSAAGTRAGRQPLPGPAPRVAALFGDPAPDPDWSDRAAVVRHIVEGERPYAGSLGFDEARTRRVAEAVVARTRDVEASLTNHWVVITGADDSTPFRMADLRVPALVLHGTDDPMFPPPHGEVLAAEIPGATFVPLPGMGHEAPPPATWDVVVPAIARHTAGGGDGLSEP